MKITKIERVLTHLINNKIIDQKIAGQKYNCWRLSSIIFDLRRFGLDIVTLSSEEEPCQYYLRSREKAQILRRDYEAQRVTAHRRQFYTA